MAQSGQTDKYRNMLINAAIITVTLIIAYNLYQASLSQAQSLKAKISEEEKKNIELEKMGKLEKRIAAYRSLLVVRETSAVMSDISDIAKETKVKVLSVKPSQKESAADYAKAIFEVTLNAGGYDQLAKFINAIEAYENVYMVEGMDISSQPGLDQSGLTVNLRISSVSANQ
ncbi:MAG: type 4a pilus biogenesis protein PilO [Candidatus Omnitrophota bacterium]|nr:type 4a pilus biogenesis protein PilO [Candidatus Omnitrophota bacterium]